MVVLNEMINGKEIKVLEASGCHDGYYWDMNAVIEYDGDVYHVVDTGSFSGYIPCARGIVKGEFDRLYGETQIDFDDWSESDFLTSAIINLMDSFIRSGAKESLEFSDDDNFHTRIYIDGKEVENF